MDENELHHVDGLEGLCIEYFFVWHIKNSMNIISNKVETINKYMPNVTPYSLSIASAPCRGSRSH